MTNDNSHTTIITDSVQADIEQDASGNVVGGQAQCGSHGDNITDKGELAEILKQYQEGNVADGSMIISGTENNIEVSHASKGEDVSPVDVACGVKHGNDGPAL